MTFDGRLFAGITVLAAVAESGSFVRAAEALGVSPSGVSRAISRLEKQIGVRLLDRTTRSQTLTDEGRRLYQTVSPHLVGIECAASTASGSAGVVQGKLRVNVDPFFSRTVLASKLPGFLRQFPELSVELIMRDDVGDLVADGFDLAIRFGPPHRLVLWLLASCWKRGSSRLRLRLTLKATAAPIVLMTSSITNAYFSTIPYRDAPLNGSSSGARKSSASRSPGGCWSPMSARC
ncbi:DNA-binding transcriptional LysR family regulator [Paraburkholderia youngii]